MSECKQPPQEAAEPMLLSDDAYAGLYSLHEALDKLGVWMEAERFSGGMATLKQGGKTILPSGYLIRMNLESKEKATGWMAQLEPKWKELSEQRSKRSLYASRNSAEYRALNNLSYEFDILSPDIVDTKDGLWIGINTLEYLMNGIKGTDLNRYPYGLAEGIAELVVNHSKEKGGRG
ncbi:MAG: hypothetical protein ACKVOE_03620 [Rickettsiales bacterium]